MQVQQPTCYFPGWATCFLNLKNKTHRIKKKKKDFRDTSTLRILTEGMRWIAKMAFQQKIYIFIHCSSVFLLNTAPFLILFKHNSYFEVACRITSSVVVLYCDFWQNRHFWDRMIQLLNRKTVRVGVKRSCGLTARKTTGRTYRRYKIIYTRILISVGQA